MLEERSEVADPLHGSSREEQGELGARRWPNTSQVDGNQGTRTCPRCLLGAGQEPPETRDRKASSSS